jgi:hypothetical protein
MRIFLTFLSLIILNSLFAQEDSEKPKDRPVRAPFTSGYLIDNQTTLVYPRNTFEYVIQHRFGDMTNGISDVFGMYAPGANIRMALNYVIYDNVQIGYGLAKKNMYSDFNIKWAVFEQTRKNTFPVALTFYANFGIDSREKSVFGKDFKSADRISYFSQAIVSRKFNHWLSLQVASSFTHYNKVDSLLDHDKIALHFSGKASVSPTLAVIFNYDLPLKIKGISEHLVFTNHPKPNFAIGIEIGTTSHAFQIFAGTSNAILPQDIIMYNQNDWTKGEMSLGFVMTRVWNF